MINSIIVGGTKGLGRVVAGQFAERGDTVSLIGRTELTSEVLKAGNVRSYKANICDNDSIRAALDSLVKEHGNVNYCVFLQRYRDEGDNWMGEFETTLTATKNIVEDLVPYFSGTRDN